MRYKISDVYVNVSLKAMLDKWDNKELDFTPTCPREIYNEQMDYMMNYMTVLANRAYLEGIDLSNKDLSEDN